VVASNPDTDVTKLSAGGVSHTGFVRSVNEDAYLVTSDICVVADGMGGHALGDLASRRTVEVFERAGGDGRLAIQVLRPLIDRANDAVLELGGEESPAGTTLVGVALVDNGGSLSAVVFNVGDSRCYRLCDDHLVQLTRDHSHVQELVDAGSISHDEVREHPLRNVVTRALGIAGDVTADFTIISDEQGRLLLCSDGVHNELDDQEISTILRSGTAQESALGLIEAVLAGPARDNATAVVVDFDLRSSDDTTVPIEQLRQQLADITAPRLGGASG
jgi:protein phosphatase